MGNGDSSDVAEDIRNEYGCGEGETTAKGELDLYEEA
jgi:hypothetical protein